MWAEHGSGLCGAGRAGPVVAVCLLLVQGMAVASPSWAEAYKRDVIQASNADVSGVLAHWDARDSGIGRQRLAMMDQLGMDLLSDLAALNAIALLEELDRPSGSGG